MTTGFRVTELFAFLVVGPDGDEGVPAVQGDNGWMPLVAADKTRLDGLRPYADQVADQYGCEVTLARFEVRTDVETIRPSAGRTPRE